MRYIFIVCVLMFFVALPLHAEPISISHLLSNPENFDGKEVVVSGRVLGILRKHNGIWISLENGEVIGVWCPSPLAENVEFVTTYKTEGDLIQVSGIFQMACQEHDGIPDIHANSLVILKRGYRITRTTNIPLLFLSVALLLAAIWLSIRLRKNRRKIVPYWY